MDFVLLSFGINERNCSLFLFYFEAEFISLNANGECGDAGANDGYFHIFVKIP
jgi:hypothetical protein